MATNAPYYPKLNNHLSADTNSSAAATETRPSADGKSDQRLDNTAMKSSTNQHLLLYAGSAARQSATDSQQKEPEHNEHNGTLAGLVEAATTAADQVSTSVLPRKTTVVVPDLHGKRKKTCSHQHGEDHEDLLAKRCCSPSPSRDSVLIDARAAGVHSAAALFRRSSSKTTRKYTRPPMSKLFMSLNVTPENFIALQALAKTYMLSPAHPERQSCVGNRGKGDSDMVKLRLFNCVKDFLTGGGIGEKFFGEHAEKPGARESHEAAAALGEEDGGGERLVWPRDGNKIIGLVTPLMRRMVTNERQRLYAIDSRKSGKKAETDSSVEDPTQHSSPDTPTANTELQLQAALDPTLQCSTTFPTPLTSPGMAATSYTNTVESSSTSRAIVITSPMASSAPSPTNAADPHLTNINIFLTYVNSTFKSVKLDEKRILTARPAHLTFYNYAAFLEQVTSMVARADLLHRSIKSALTIQANESLRGLAAAANALQPDKDEQQPQQTIPLTGSASRYTVKTIGPTGWQLIESAESWYDALTERAFATWADGVCNIIVELHIDQPESAVEATNQTDSNVQMVHT
ncbi:hypothetical protein B5807_08007 [Epicoccum nigrum]|uniref:Uncharacterized protein n=1 Tax=Epicoccum nigrum TaxID=105696 RepID=A0A1Y2LPL4_EPING|nr:hypothetical protein B5807_08007 [Epicoccum nigrum]